jgi:hypothetical protein
VLTLQNLCSLSAHALKKDCLDVTLWVDYIYLDTDERRRFAQVSHEYLIEQLQFINANSGKNCVDFTFNHPVKEIIWIGAPRDEISAECAGRDGEQIGKNNYSYFNFDASHLGPTGEGPDIITNPGVGMINGAYFQGPSTPTPIINETPGELGSAGPKFLIKLNGHDRFNARDYRYFTRAQVLQHHTGYGGVELRSLMVQNELLQADMNFGAEWQDGTLGAGGWAGMFDQVNLPTLGDTIGVYSFALKPEEHQPSGTCNFSRIDTAQLCVNCGNTVKSLYIYAINYNVLRIMSGMGGLAYSN